MARNAATDEPLYRQVAHSIEQQIGRGVLRVGDKVPSVRSFSRPHRVSISTALQAYFWLEHRGYIEPRPRSGFYEDDVYGDLAFDGRARTLKSYDQRGLVLLCSSFSKVLAPGLRIGWIHAGKFQTEVEKVKYVTTIASPSLAQLAVADCLQSGRYERYLRKLRRIFSDQVQSASAAVVKYFPPGTRMTRPRGGYMLWIELPKGIDAFQVYREALQKNISIMPGTIFSPRGRFKNHIRISCNHQWSEKLDHGLQTLGQLCRVGRPAQK